MALPAATRSCVRFLILGTALLAFHAVVARPASAQGLGLGLAPDAAALRWNAGLGLDDAVFYGGHATLEFGRYVRLQGGLRQASGVETRFGDHDLSGVENVLDATMASTGVLLRLGSRRIAPLVAASGGVMRFEPEGRDRTDQVFVGWGGGIGVRPLPWVEGRFLVQDVRMRLDRSLLAAPGGSVEDPGAGDLRRNVMATLGVGLRFGGRTSARADSLDRDMGGILQGGTEGLLVPLELHSGVMRFDDALGVGDQANVGVRAGVDLGPYFGLRGMYWRGVSDGFDAFQDVQGWSGEAQFNLGRVTRASPFLLLGYGQVLFDEAYRNDVGLAVPDQNAVIVGAGFGYPLSDRSRFLVALRDHVTTTGALDAASTPSDLRHTLALDAGVSFLLRGRATRPTVVPVPAVLPGGEPPEGVRAGPAPAPPSTDSTRTVMAVATPDGAAVVLIPDSTGRGFQSDRTVTLPIPAVGEIYIRYGPPSQPPTLPSPTAPPARTGATDSVALAAAVRDEVARGSVVTGDPGTLSRADLAALEARLLARLDARAMEEATRTPAEANELARLEAQVRELTRIVREGMVQQADAGLRTIPLAQSGYEPPGVVERRPFFGGLDVRLGTATVDDGGTGVGGSMALSLGALTRGALRPFVAVEAGRSSVRTRLGESSVIGSVTSVGGGVGTFLDARSYSGFMPSLSLGVTGLGGSVSGDTEQDDELLNRLYEGFSVGPDVGLHLAYRAPASRYILTGGVRRLWAGSRSRWAVEAGLRLPGRAPALGRVSMRTGVAAETLGRGVADDTTAPAVGPPTTPAAEPDSALMARLAALETALARESEARRAAEDSALARARSDERTRAEAAARADAVARAEALARVEAQAREAEARAFTAEAAAAAAARTAEARAALRRDLESLVGVLPDVLTVRGTDRGLEVVLGGGMFAVGSATVGSQGRAAVERIGARLRGLEQNVLVEGHTDASGSPEANLDLSRRRAEAVLAALVATGVAPDRLRAVGSGEAVPIAGNDSAQGRARNRRVEIVILASGATP